MGGRNVIPKLLTTTTVRPSPRKTHARSFGPGPSPHMLCPQPEQDLQVYSIAAQLLPVAAVVMPMAAVNGEPPEPETATPLRNTKPESTRRSIIAESQTTREAVGGRKPSWLPRRRTPCGCTRETAGLLAAGYRGNC